MPTLCLLDGHALAYRAYYALTAGADASRWVTQSGEPTAGTYGFVTILLKILEQDRPDYLAVSFDVGRTFRHDLFADYKATRAKMPDDLRAQLGRIQELVTAFQIPVLTVEGYEADDVLGTVARRAAAQGVQVKIITGDRDLLQLADAHITITLSGHRLADAQDYGPEEVKAKYGLTPTQYLDFKALVGDKSDNIPGVPGIGEKTALALLQRYGSLAGLYAHLAEIPARFSHKLEAGRAAADLSLRLATIVTNVPVAFDLETCRTGRYDRERIVELFRVLEFNSLLKRLPGGAASTGESPAAGAQLGLFADLLPAPAARPPAEGLTQVTLVQTPTSLAELARTLAHAEFVTVDVETTSTDPMRAALLGVSLCIQAGAAYYLPVEAGAPEPGGEPPAPQLHLPEAGPTLRLKPAEVIAALTPALANPQLPKYGHNLKYDYAVLARYGLELQGIAFDTFLAEWVSNPASHSLGLKKLAFVRLGVEMTEITELIGRGKKQITLDQVPVEQVAAYAAADADMTTRLVSVLREELARQGQLKLLTEVELPLIPILAHMEMAGVALDGDYLRGISGELQTQLAQIEKDICAQVGYAFNLNSPQQLSEALFGKLQLQPPDPRRQRKTSTGRFSTAADVLEEMRGQHPVIDLILEQRELAKLKSTYVDALPQAVNPATGRVHTSYNQAGTVTGRLASSEPNLQNIPVRTERGRRVRRAFVAAPGNQLLSADYSQIELRLAAHFSQDETLLRAFQAGEDIHTATAAAVLGLPPEQVTKAQRRNAKAINFGLLYGMGPFALSKQTGLTLPEAENFVKNYFARFPGIKKYIDETKRLVAERGYVETLLGRRCYFPMLVRATAEAQTAALRSRAEREAINAPVQGSAADIIKLAMRALPAALAGAHLAAQVLLQVHDELVLECPVVEVEKTAQVVRAVMERAYTLTVPLVVDVCAGPNWDELQPVSVSD